MADENQNPDNTPKKEGALAPIIETHFGTLPDLLDRFRELLQKTFPAVPPPQKF